MIKVTCAGQTDVGLQREHNEDSFCLCEEHSLYVVADGMGGHRAGDIASKMATAVLSRFFSETQREDVTWPFHYDPKLTVEENRLVSGIKLANKKIFEASYADKEMYGMGTTVVALVHVPDRARAYIAHVGDSRAYRIRDKKITMLTRDHSLINEYMIFLPDISPEQRQELPKNVITRALGMQSTVVVDVTTEEVLPGDIFLLCSDGLSGMLSDEKLCEVVLAADGNLDKGCKALIQEANENGGEDNITVVLVAADNKAKTKAQSHPPAQKEEPSKGVKRNKSDKSRKSGSK